MRLGLEAKNLCLGSRRARLISHGVDPLSVGLTAKGDDLSLVEPRGGLPLNPLEPLRSSASDGVAASAMSLVRREAWMASPTFTAAKDIAYRQNHASDPSHQRKGHAAFADAGNTPRSSNASKIGFS